MGKRINLKNAHVLGREKLISLKSEKGKKKEKKVYQKILRLHISMANPWNSMDICQPSKNLSHVFHLLSGFEKLINKMFRKKLNPYLIHIEFHIDEGHSLVDTAVVLENPVHSLGNILHNQI